MTKNPTRVVADRDHITEMEELVGQATDHVEVATPYFDLKAVRRLTGALRAEADLSFTFAWPAEDDTPAAVSPDALALLLKGGHEVSYVLPKDRLHGKVYLADGDAAIVTSANLTARGLGLHDHANAELGLRTTDPESVEAVRQWVVKLPRHALTKAGLEELRSWARRGSDTPPPPPPKMPVDRAVVEKALNRARDRGIVRAFAHVPRHFGHNAFEIQIPGVRGWLTIRARVTESEDTRRGLSYHFELTPPDAAYKRLDGFVFVPVDHGRRLLGDDDAPVLFLPFDRVVGRNRTDHVTLGQLRSVGRGGRRLSLESPEGGWVLRAKKTQVDLGGCANDTSAFRSYYL